MLINDVAQKYNITVRTLRYYEEIGLLTLERNSSNVRVFSSNQTNRLEDILLLKTFNFSLEDIVQILDSETTTLKDDLSLQLKEIESSIQELNYKKRLITSLLNTYGSGDITKHNLKTFVREQLYFKNERILTMITKAENIVLEISETLVPLATNENNGSLILEIKTLRESLKQNNNVILEKMHIKDNLNDLKNFEFQILQNNTIILKDNVADIETSQQVPYIINKLHYLIINN